MEYVAGNLHNGAYLSVLGIDPGYATCGVTLIQDAKLGPVVHHSVTLKTPKGMTYMSRLAYIMDSLTGIVKTHTPDALALEGYTYYRDRTEQHTTQGKHHMVLGAIWGNGPN